MSQQEKYIEGARRKLEEVALNYARMKALGEYFEDGIRRKISFDDWKDYTEMFKNNLARAAEDLFAEISLTPLPERKSNV